MSYHFLLGGYDLEMMEIRSLLEQVGCSFTDLRLAWGAKLSAYAKNGFPVLPLDHTLVGIELIEDILPPQNYIRIDHHNDWSDRPASILQVAVLLGIEADWRMLLVAANDSRYIEGMKAIGATASEIAQIRLEDRQCQGVTEADERLAKEAIKERAVKNGITVVEARSPRFSPIADRLWGKTNNRLLIIHKAAFTYYGEGVTALRTHFAPSIATHRAYTGGGETGFFGGTFEYISKEELFQTLSDHG